MTQKGQNLKKQNPLIKYQPRTYPLRPCEDVLRGLGEIVIPQVFGPFVAQKDIDFALCENYNYTFDSSSVAFFESRNYGVVFI